MPNKKEDSQVKSWILLLAGLAGIGYQQYTGETDIVLLLIFTAMTGVPGLTQLISLIKNSPIVLQSSSSQQDHLGSDSGNSSTNSSEGNP